MKDRSRIIKNVCDALLAGDKSQASAIARHEYPFEGRLSAGRAYTPFQSTYIFIRDGFIDRYSGDRLVFPAVLRLLSRLLPEDFPAHPSWKMSDSHIVYWEFFPTIDHIIPVARGGADEERNWATTSMMRNSAKSNWTLEELGWHLLPPGDFKEWDGLISWLMKYIEDDPLQLREAYIKRWYNAAARATKAV
jgi:5-methylcytosine-specific restriction endonuclease McrA